MKQRLIQEGAMIVKEGVYKKEIEKEIYILTLSQKLSSQLTNSAIKMKMIIFLLTEKSIL